MARKLKRTYGWYAVYNDEVIIKAVELAKIIEYHRDALKFVTNKYNREINADCTPRKRP